MVRQRSTIAGMMMLVAAVAAPLVLLREVMAMRGEPAVVVMLCLVPAWLAAIVAARRRPMTGRWWGFVGGVMGASALWGLAFATGQQVLMFHLQWLDPLCRCIVRLVDPMGGWTPWGPSPLCWRVNCAVYSAVMSGTSIMVGLVAGGAVGWVSRSRRGGVWRGADGGARMP